ncbi:alpha/beta fold hydrolase [Marinitoga lauensis]|uniref:alpha/beta fold hydrolase n=1 Tax=Marinitoga lauensis TaxID=2201189 RepID=UPI001981FCC7|nr:alpha/beta hydrolase [Marinitoga lauensis]
MGIYYEIHGEGYPLVLMNGIMMNTASWKEHINILKKYFKVIVYDMRDQGRSIKMKKNYNIDIHADDLYKFLNYLNLDKVNLLGLSYGGQVAEIFAIKYPEKINKLILSNTTYKVDKFLVSIGKSWNVAARLYDGEKFFDLALPFIYSKDFYNNNFDWLQNRKKLFKKLLTKDWFDAFIRLSSSNLTFDVTNELSKIKKKLY